MEKPPADNFFNEAMYESIGAVPIERYTKDLLDVIQKEIHEGKTFIDEGNGCYVAYGSIGGKNARLITQVTLLRSPAMEVDGCAVMIISVDKQTPEDVRQYVLDQVSSVDADYKDVSNTVAENPDALVYTQSNYEFRIFNEVGNLQAGAMYESFIKVVRETKQCERILDRFIITPEGLRAYDGSGDMLDNVRSVSNDANLYTRTAR